MNSPLPCPWCGQIPAVDDGATGATIECVNAKCTVRPTAFCDHDDDADGMEIALIAWNNRAEVKP